MAELHEASKNILRELARSVALFRGSGRTLDDLPATERGLLQAMDEAQRDVFMAELAEAGAEEARSRFRDQLRQWRAQQAG
jgi:hypothetical protein